MSHTNSTQYYSLPQFESTDKPSWLSDVNPAYSAIDTGIHAAKAAADAAQSDATQALSDASSAGTTATGADSKASGLLASVADAFDTTATYSVDDLVMFNNLLYRCTVAVTTPGPWTGTTNWTRETIEQLIDTIMVNNVAINDVTNTYITLSTGYSLDAGSRVYKQGKHVWGNILIVASSALPGANDSVTIGSINSSYRTEAAVNGFCGLSNGQWFTNDIGYVYIAVNGSVAVASASTGKTYIKIMIDYCTA